MELKPCPMCGQIDPVSYVTPEEVCAAMDKIAAMQSEAPASHCGQDTKGDH